MLKKTRNIIIFCSVIFFALSILVFVFVYTQTIKINQKAKDISLEFGKEETRRNEIKALNNTVKSIEVERTLLDGHFAYKGNVVPFLDNLEDLASAVGAKASIISADEAKDVSVLSINLEAEGSFSSIYKFLTLLENSQYSITIDSMDLSKTPSLDVDSAVSLWEINLKIRLISYIK